MSAESFSLYFNHKMDCWIKLIPAVTLLMISTYFSPTFTLACACTSLLHVVTHKFF